MPLLKLIRPPLRARAVMAGASEASFDFASSPLPSHGGGVVVVVGGGGGGRGGGSGGSRPLLNPSRLPRRRASVRRREITTAVSASFSSFARCCCSCFGSGSGGGSGSRPLACASSKLGFEGAGEGGAGSDRARVTLPEAKPRRRCNVDIIHDGDDDDEDAVVGATLSCEETPRTEWRSAGSAMAEAAAAVVEKAKALV
jgi:hypothetical protein